MYCRICGKKLQEDDKFCSNCGAEVIADNEETPQTQTAQTNEEISSVTPTSDNDNNTSEKLEGWPFGSRNDSFIESSPFNSKSESFVTDSPFTSNSDDEKKADNDQNKDYLAESPFTSSNDKDEEEKDKNNVTPLYENFIWNIHTFPGMSSKESEDVDFNWETGRFTPARRDSANEGKGAISDIEDYKENMSEQKDEIADVNDEMASPDKEKYMGFKDIPKEDSSTEDEQAFTDDGEEEDDTTGYRVPTAEDAVSGVALETELFKNLSDSTDEARKQSENIDKFFTFNKKNEEFQQLLDKEYDRIKEGEILKDERIVANENVEDKFLSRSTGSLEKLFEEQGISIDEPKDVDDSAPGADAGVAERRSEDNCAGLYDNIYSNIYEDIEKETETTSAPLYQATGFDKEDDEPVRDISDIGADVDPVNHITEMAKAREKLFNQETGSDEKKDNLDITRMFDKAELFAAVALDAEREKIEDAIPDEQESPKSTGIAEDSPLTDSVTPDIFKTEDVKPEHESGFEPISDNLSQKLYYDPDDEGTATYDDKDDDIPGMADDESKMIKPDDSQVSNHIAGPEIATSSQLANLWDQVDTSTNDDHYEDSATEMPASSPINVKGSYENATADSVGAVSAGEESKGAGILSDIGKPPNVDGTVPEEGVAPEKKKNKGRLILKICLVILIVFLVLELIVVGVRKFAPDSALGQFIDKKVVNIVDGAGNFFRSGRDGEASALENDRTKPEKDKTSLIEYKENENSNNNIKKIQYNEKLKYDPEKEYSNGQISGTQPLKNVQWYKDSDGNDVYYDAEIVGAVIAFESEKVDMANKGDDKVLSHLQDGSALYSETVATGEDDITLTFDMLELGEIRHSGDDYYIWVAEDVKEKQNSQTSIKTYNKVYMLQPKGKKMLIADYYNV